MAVNHTAASDLEGRNKMFSKKRKIRKYLDGIEMNKRSAFEQLLSDYLEGTLQDALLQAGVEKPEIHVDFLDDYKCIDIQGKCRQNYVGIQIEETEFTIGIDPDEPDEPDYYPLESKGQFYKVLSGRLTE